MKQTPPSSDGLHPFLAHHAARQTSATERMADRLAPQENHQSVDFNSDAIGTVKNMGMTGQFNKIEHALTAGKVSVYLAGNTSANADYVLDAAIPGPIYFPRKSFPSIAFRAGVAPFTAGTVPVGRIHVENY